MSRHVVTTADELTKLPINWDKIAFDTETTSLNYYELDIVGMSIYDGNVAVYIDIQNSHEPDKLLSTIRILFLSTKLLIAHNMAYDLKVLKKIAVTTNATLFCTLTASHLINENAPKGLKELASSILNHSIITYKEAIKHGTDSDVFREYATNDAIWTWGLFEHFAPLLHKQGMAHLFKDIEMPFQHVLVEMESHGIKIDKEVLQDATKELRDEAVRLQIDMHTMLNLPYELQANLNDGSLVVCSQTNFDSSQQLIQIIEGLGLEVTETTDTGNKSVGRKTIERLKGKHKFVDLLHRYRVISKLLNAFFIPMPSFIDADGRLRASFNNCGTVTGRLSSSKPNLQQTTNKKLDGITYSVRDCFVASIGCKMIACDFSSQEVRVAAQQSNDPTLVKALRNGMDLHLTVANRFFELGIPEEKLYSTHPEFESLKDKYKKERTNAKIVTFGLLYGKSPFGLAQDFGISEDEAQKLIDKYFAGMPEVKKDIDRVHKEVEQKGYVTYMSKRRRHFTKIRRDNWEGYPKKAYRQSYNATIQGFSSDMMRKAMVMVHQNRKPEWGLYALATVHDEAIYEVKEPYAEEAAAFIKQQFESCVNLIVPVESEVNIGQRYSECK